MNTRRSVLAALFLIIGVWVMLTPGSGNLSAKGFPKTFAEVAVPEHEMPKVIKGHPRLLLRGNPWSGGLSLNELKTRATQKPWSSQIEKMKKKLTRPKFFNKYCDQVALYYLLTGDETVVPQNRSSHPNSET